MICIVPLYEGSEQTLGDVVIHEMCVEEEGNVNPRQDPHGELVNKNVLTRIHSKVMQKIKVGVEMTNLIIEISIPKPSHFAWTKSDLKTVSEFIVHNWIDLLIRIPNKFNIIITIIIIINIIIGIPSISDCIRNHCDYRDASLLT